MTSNAYSASKVRGTDLEGDITAIPQYGLGQTLLVWAAAAIPMAVLGWVATPVLAANQQMPGLWRAGALTVGLAWQFVLVVLLIRREAGRFSWSEFRRRLWLNAPRDPETGQTRGRLWLWLIPLIALAAVYGMQVAKLVDRLWASVFPFLVEPPAYSLGALTASPDVKAQLVGHRASGPCSSFRKCSTQ